MTTATASELARSPADYPPCTAASLAGFPWTHPAFGKQIPGIALRNYSLASCRVAGFPTVRAYTASGAPARVRFVHKFFADSRVYAYTIRPGDAAFFPLYGNPPRGAFDRSRVGIAQFDVVLPGDTRAIDVTAASGTCGGTMTVSQMFPVSELTI